MNDKINDDRAVKLLTKNPTMGRTTLSRELGITEHQAKKLVDAFRAKKPMPVVNTAKSATGEKAVPMRFKKAVSAEEFRRQFDVPLKIRTALKGLESAKDPTTGEKLEAGVIADNDFRLELGIQSTQWSAARQSAEFQPYQITIKGKIYWAPPSVIKQVRETIDIS